MRWRRRHHGEDGFFSNRGVGVAVTTVALIATGFGIAGTGKGGAPTTSPTTTLPATTTTVPGTTTTGASTTTSSTIPGADPCLGTLGIPNGACAANTGVSQTYLASQGFTNASQLPLYTGSLSPPCGTVITGRRITGGFNMNYGNGTHSASSPCVTVVNSLISVNGAPGNAAVSVPYMGSGSCSNLTSQVFPDGTAHQRLCGPFVLTDTEVSINGCSGCASPTPGGSFSLDGPNIHCTRCNVHGMSTQMFNNAAYDEFNYSFGHGMTNITGDNHMAALAVNTGSTGQYVTVDHSTLSCDSAVTQGGATGGCSAVTNIYIQRSDSHDIAYTNNFFWQADGVDGGAGIYSLYLGITDAEAGRQGVFNGYNITWAHNWLDHRTWVYQGSIHGGPVFGTYNPTYGKAHGDTVCDNKYPPSQQNIAWPIVPPGISGGTQWIADSLPTGVTSCPGTPLP